MQVITDFFNKHQINPKALAVGVSGGADSLALVLWLKESLPDVKIIGLTVDHGLRPTSRQEAEYVADILAQNQIEHHILTWDGEKPTTGIEEQARIARYHLLCDWCKAHNISYLAIAHHLFDQAETFLMRLERGSGLYGLSAIQEISESYGIQILRPLLHISPENLKAYLSQHQIKWIEDESNRCTDFLRVKMRQFLPILSKNTGITPERIDLAVQNLQRSRQFMEDMVFQTIQNKVHLWNKSGASFDTSEFLSWHQELKFYVLSTLICQISGNIYIPQSDALCTLINELNDSNFAGATLGGICFQKSDLRIWLIKENRDIKTNYKEEDWICYEQNNPAVRGLKIPSKLKQALIYEKKHKK